MRRAVLLISLRKISKITYITEAIHPFEWPRLYYKVCGVWGKAKGFRALDFCCLLRYYKGLGPAFFIYEYRFLGAYAEEGVKMRPYTTIAAEAVAEYTEKRSRFLGLAAPVATEAEAAAVLDNLRARHHDANHNCYAYILRSPDIARYSDDGEPSGTAGLPILEVLRRQGLVDVITVVTRYFGGTLLGAGGLVRAYSKSAALALGSAGAVRMEPCAVFDVALPYHHYGRVGGILPRYGISTLFENYTEVVNLTLRISATKLPAFQKELAELTAGEAGVIFLREEFAVC
jgi:uncharacterized YigZ family protein